MRRISEVKRSRGKASTATQDKRVIERRQQTRRARPASADAAENDLSEVSSQRWNKSYKARGDEGDSVTRYQYLAPTTRGVPRHTIDTKWEPLSTSSIDQISQLLNDVERSVIVRLQDDRKRTQASTAVQMVSRRLRRKLTRGQPFPPSTRSVPEEDFDFEKILDSSKALEAQLAPVLHSVELLKAEKAKEEALLEAETTALEVLEANAKAEASRRKKAERTLHDILRDNHDDHEEELQEKSNLVDCRPQQRLLRSTSADEDLQPIIGQLQNHLESIQTNVNQVRGLSSAMGGSRAALQDVIFKHLGRTRYEQVILG